jgi:hypothetical protein
VIEPCVLRSKLKTERPSMTPEEVECMKVLCQQIETEKDHKRFSQLIAELNELLERKNKRLDNPHSPTESK